MWAWSNTGTDCPERLWLLHPWTYSTFNGTWSWATCGSWPYSKQGVRLDDLQRCLPDLPFLWGSAGSKHLWKQSPSDSRLKCGKRIYSHLANLSVATRLQEITQLLLIHILSPPFMGVFTLPHTFSLEGTRNGRGCPVLWVISILWCTRGLKEVLSPLVSLAVLGQLKRDHNTFIFFTWQQKSLASCFALIDWEQAK